MKRGAVAVVVLIWCTGTTLLAQADTQRLRINGFGGFGYGNTGYRSGELFNTTYQDTSTELGLDASGYLYDPRLANFNFTSFWDGNNSSIEQGRAHSNGLNYNGNLSFIPQRSFPFNVFFTRSHVNTTGSLIPAFATTSTIWGLRGEVKQPRLALISYSLGFGNTENDLPNGEFFDTRQRFANITATRKLQGWEMRFADDLLQTKSTYSNFLDRTNTLSADATREFRQRIRVDVNALYSTFKFQDLSATNTSQSNVALLNGGASWKHSERLTSYYAASVSRNAINALRLLSNANGSPIELPFNATAINSMSENFSAGANFLATKDLTLGTSTTYTHSGIPEASLASLTDVARRALTTGSLTTGGNYSYRHKLGKLEYRSLGTLDWQHYNLLSGPSQGGIGFSLDNGIAGGNVRKLRFNTSYRYSDRTNPIFFNIAKNTDNYVNVRLDSEYFRFVNLQAMADVGKQRMELVNSNIHLDRNSYMFSASFPKLKLNAYATRGASNSLERLLGLDSLLFQPGGSTGGAAISADLLNPLIFTNVVNERAGLGWQPRRNLEIETRYSKYDYFFTFGQGSENVYRQFDTTVAYKFGRFTIFVGYGRALGEAFQYDNRVNRFYFRVRFPFHVLG